ncbi:hypothetical protein [Blastococcus brunescens]|uniref:Uncharacterized protein n=1 Tax=Blastococcus brunescens TaxID=1564165 RepID=A0ABZ1ATQ5_9ACTN|nr:hypothetical protein [Blastococcus sp. BMG 8361]WRL61962.1 hypothetical protein U6N30_17940 [Blastococcus sp. BMG 8361]
MESLAGPRQPPGWFQPSITGVLDRARVVLAARGPRQLEEATAELLGAELYRVIRDEDRGLWFDWWFEQLVDAALARIRAEGSRNDAWQAPWWLLHGLASIGSPALSAAAQTALGRATKELRRDAYQSQPEWLRLLPRISATGEMWQLRDVYGARLAVIAGFSYPGGTDRSVFLFDIDACGLVRLVHAGVFDNVDEAAAAWRSLVGDAADRSSPAPIETGEQLACLVHYEAGEELVEGTEPRDVTDNWFRASRRTHDLAQALRKRGMALPESRSLYHDIDTEPMVEAFVAWHRTTHGTEPDPEAVDAVAAEWLEGALPGTQHAASPHRAQYQLTLISDWQPEHPVTVAVKTLLPTWVRWNGEQAGLPVHFLERAVAAAAGNPGPISERCGVDPE